MKVRTAIALMIVMACSGAAEAAMREYTLTFGGGASTGQLAPVGPTMTFSYPDGSFSDDVVDSGELTATFAINHTDFPGIDFTLTQINLVPNTRYNLHFVAADTSRLQMELNAAPFNAQASGSDLPDGSEAAAFTEYFDSSGTPDEDFNVNNPSVTIGTVAAVPEPSAFAFGALALAFTGAGSWIRRRFWA